jgi:EAL domain-containing protein (putative c-di-GMP-specific phosphodiesterase class I)
VECEETLKQLRDIGIDFVQGFAIHRPEPYAELASRMDYPRHTTSCAATAA